MTDSEYEHRALYFVAYGRKRYFMPRWWLIMGIYAIKNFLKGLKR